MQASLATEEGTPGGGKERERRGVKPAIVTPPIEIRM
jgi:hypothetical protein